jgi:glycerol-3-phosphate cytidylyltransferase-like family protein/SAM-dependent methyltransferase
VITNFSDLQNIRKSVAMVDGGFDPLHQGHVAYFEAAARLGLPVLCNVSADDYIRRKHPVLLEQAARCQLIDALRHITYTHPSQTSTAAVLEQLQPRFYVKGADWRDRLPEEETRICQALGIETVFVDTVLDSSTRVMSGWTEQRKAQFRADVAEFEELVFSQKPTPAARYDEEYFSSEWRAEGNSYAIETRRKIEAKNPQLIKEVFGAQTVLDMGCGPGALMFLLHELGVRSDGIDFSPQSRAAAPPEVRDRIKIAPITQPGVVPDDAYDLVICREVLEHLTVLEVRRAVQNICRATRRFVYLTTRFHPDPPNMLSVTDEPHVDPTHITLLNKEFLRTLFVLEGCRSRPDLEQRMDWLNKGRVLAFEKVSLGGDR